MTITVTFIFGVAIGFLITRIIWADFKLGREFKKHHDYLEKVIGKFEEK